MVFMIFLILSYVFDIYFNSIKLDIFEEEKIDGYCCKM